MSVRDPFLDRLIDLALEEDLGSSGDITTNALIPPRAMGRAELWAKESMVLSGLSAFRRTFERVDATTEVTFDLGDGDQTSNRQRVAVVTGKMRALLTGERTALNIVQRMAGIATLTSGVVQALSEVRGSRLRILDTRKTPPAMRRLSKDAVRHGGAQNHRFGLFDGVLIKDNHIAAVGGSVADALRLAKASVSRLVKIEIEVTSIAQLREAIAEGAHIVMLDNMNDDQIREAVAVADGRVELEVSGGITPERLVSLAKIGVDYVSMGMLTHSARAMDLSLEIVGESKT